MAKDGTNRGGARIGAGAKKKPLADKIAEGNPGKRALTVISFDDRAAELEGQAMPKPSKMLSAVQKDGKALVAEDIYKETWEWLAERGCASLVSPQLLERYAMSVARWIQCEEAVTEFGFLAKHPTTAVRFFALCGDESELYEPDQPALDGDIPNRKENCRPSTPVSPRWMIRWNDCSGRGKEADYV